MINEMVTIAIWLVGIGAIIALGLLGGKKFMANKKAVTIKPDNIKNRYGQLIALLQEEAADVIVLADNRNDYQFGLKQNMYTIVYGVSESISHILITWELIPNESAVQFLVEKYNTEYITKVGLEHKKMEWSFKKSKSQPYMVEIILSQSNAQTPYKV